ncbi:unnamed protein product [Lampetra planeri]
MEPTGKRTLKVGGRIALGPAWLSTSSPALPNVLTAAERQQNPAVAGPIRVSQVVGFSARFRAPRSARRSSASAVLRERKMKINRTKKHGARQRSEERQRATAEATSERVGTCPTPLLRGKAEDFHRASSSCARTQATCPGTEPGALPGVAAQPKPSAARRREPLACSRARALVLRSYGKENLRIGRRCAAEEKAGDQYETCPQHRTLAFKLNWSGGAHGGGERFSRRGGATTKQQMALLRAKALDLTVVARANLKQPRPLGNVFTRNTRLCQSSDVLTPPVDGTTGSLHPPSPLPADSRRQRAQL